MRTIIVLLYFLSLYITPGLVQGQQSPQPTQYTINATALEHGSISPSGAVNVSQGGNQTFSIIPDAGYAIDKIIVDGLEFGTESSYTFYYVFYNHSITAKFIKTDESEGISIDGDASLPKTITIMSSAGVHGSISPIGDVRVYENGNQKFTMIPNYGYQIDSVFVDGILVGNTDDYTFMNTTADHSIRATFSPAIYTINADAGPGGIIKPAGTIQLKYGSDQSFSIYPVIGHHIKVLIVDGVEQTGTSEYSFNNVSMNHTIEAKFEKDK